MAITFREREFSGFQTYINQTASRAAANTEETPAYAHPVDGWILHTLNATPIRSVLSRAVDVAISVQFGHMLSASIPIDQYSFPELFEVLAHCAQTLNIPMPHAVAVNRDATLNAATAGTDEYHFVLVTAALCQMYSKEEASFVVGHECGHIAANHALYRTVVLIMSQALGLRIGLPRQLLQLAIGIPINAWSRRAEVTADRAGLLCCGDLATAERALVRLIAGLADIERVDIEEYLRRSRAMEEYHSLGMANELFATHPMIARRVQALRMFANSELYYDLTGKPRPADKRLLTRAELDRQVNEIVKP